MTIKEFMQKLGEAIINQDIPEDAEIAVNGELDLSDGIDVFYDTNNRTVWVSGS